MQKTNYLLVGYKVRNGFKIDFRVLGESNTKERLEYLMGCNYNHCEDLKAQGYIVEIYKLEQ